MRKYVFSALMLILIAGCSQQKIMRTAIQTDQAPAAIGPFSQGVLVGPTLYISGQLGIDPATGKMVEGVEAQVHRSMDNLSAILQKAGFTFDDVVVTQVFLADMENFGLFNKIYAAYFKNNLPVRALVQPARIPKDGLVEIMMTAVKAN